jgi:hypothetical protein
MSKKSRRLEDRIRELCTKVVASKDAEELEPILSELKGAIHQAVERVRARAIAVLGTRGGLPVERRKFSNGPDGTPKKRDGTNP